MTVSRSSPYLAHLQCPLCRRQYALEAVTYTCPTCGPAGTLDMIFDLERLRAHLAPDQLAAHAAPADFSMWRYGPLLPVAPPARLPALPVGWTPLLRAERLAAELGLESVWLKDEGRNPTASLKDRASAMVVARALHLGAPVITTASSGNAAAALAGLCASAGLRAVIFVPASAPEAKITQLLAYGATVFLVQGSYDDAFDLSVQAAEAYGWYCRNTGMNPYTTEGKKTAALEIAEQLGWQAPDVLVLSVGDGNILAGQHKGFADLLALGWIDHMPRLIGVQAAGSASLADAWARGLDVAAVANLPPGPAETVADSISVGLPRDRVKALRAVRESGGAFVKVPDEAILNAIPRLARSTGVFAEPAAAAATAGLFVALEQGLVARGERVVVLNTGHGLKDVGGARRAIAQSGAAAHPVAPALVSLAELIRRERLEIEHP